MEIWKDIKGYEGYYQISNLGNVKSLNRKVICKNGKVKILKGKLLKLDNNYGYLIIDLRKNDIPNRCRVHRLVAKAFVENPENKEYVNHINGIKSDNRVENLEWCTASENNLHAVKTGLMKMESGEKCRSAKFTDAEILLIRNLKNKYTQEEISKMFNSSRAYISMIHNNKLRT